MKSILLVTLSLLVVYVASQGNLCTVVVPANPLSAAGLATPYQVTGQGCVQNSTLAATFVQGAYIDPATGLVNVYNPLAIQQGTNPAAGCTPQPPNMPNGAVVGIWFGSNSNAVQLSADVSGQSLIQGNCVNGLANVFGQFAYCNAPNFFAAANTAIQQGKLIVPTLGMAPDGMPCPTTRDFFVVDQDQSDNVVTTYLVAPGGLMCQNTAAFKALYPAAVTLSNGSDEKLVAIAIDGAFGAVCAPWKVPDAADNQNPIASLPMNELLAQYRQQAPIAMVPDGDPMVQENGVNSLTKLNLYRAGVGQMAAVAGTFSQSDTIGYCNQIVQIAPPRILQNQALFSAAASPMATAANSLYTFLGQRLQAAFQILNCTGLLNVQNPVTAMTVNGAGVVTAVTITPVAAVNMDCALIVPDNVLTAAGLATPFQLTSINGNGPCNQANPNQAAFVQGAVIDTVTGAIYVYNPLVIDQGTTALVAPVTPFLPVQNVIALWFGFNGNTLTLQGAQPQTLTNANCVTGSTISNAGIFGQFSFCNALNFFQAANAAIANGQLIVPPLGSAKDGQPCPTVRSFFVVDQDQSDNVLTTYLNVGGKTVQNTQQNRAQFAATGEIVETNASDNRLTDIFLDGALGCAPWTVTDLADPQNKLPALPLNELLAAAWQPAPVALIPSNDPMTLNANTGKPDLFKLLAYRLGVNQPAVSSLAQADTKIYCTNMLQGFLPRAAGVKTSLQGMRSPDLNNQNLMGFLTNRYIAALQILNCTGLLGVQVAGPNAAITPVNDALGRTFDAVINLAVVPPVTPVAPVVTPAPVNPITAQLGAIIAGSVVGGALLIGAIVIAIVIGFKYKRSSGGFSRS